LSALGSIAEVAERAIPSVVSVASTRAAAVGSENPFDLRRFFEPDGASPFPMPPGQAPEQQGLGSGVIIAPNLILTNAHVVEGATRLEITAQDKRSLEAQLVGSDPKSDLALLRILGDTTGLRPLEFADSGRARLGEVVLAIGNPFGVGQTVTMGIVSAKGRANLGIVDYEDFIQTDAAINPGNSGGALVDLNGKLVGIPTAILSRTGGYMGVGFAIPSNMAKPIMNSLLQHGRVARGYLGVAIQEIDREIATALSLPNTEGVLIADVEPNSPAAKAGLTRGDVILSIDGAPMRSTGELRNRIAAAPVDKAITLEVLRGGQRRQVKATLVEMPSAKPGPGADKKGPARAEVAGLSAMPLDDALRSKIGVPREIRQGLVVTNVEPGSSAARAGVRAGDVLVELAKRPLVSLDDFRRAWSGGKGPIAALIYRDGRTFYVAFER
jgi:serine protease Do